MLDALIFVRGAISKKDFVPAMSHFTIGGEGVYANNGVVSLYSPIDLDLVCTPKALPLLRALHSADAALPTQLALTKAGRLSIKSGNFRAHIECLPEPPPQHLPEGTLFVIDGKKLLEKIKLLKPFIGSDASRPWCNGLLFTSDKIAATNNIIYIDTAYKLHHSFHETFNLPAQTIEELLRIAVPPDAVQVSETSATFHYNGGRWLRSQLLPLGWPDTQKLFSVEFENNTTTPLDANFFDSIEKLLPFTDELRSIYFTENGLATGQEKDMGAHIDSVADFPKIGRYNGDMLLLFKNVPVKFYFHLYPAPVLFTDKSGTRGALVGLRT